MGDPQRVQVHGSVVVVNDPAYVLPCYVMHYSGHTPSRSTISHRVLTSPYYYYFTHIAGSLALAFSIITLLFSFLVLFLLALRLFHLSDSIVPLLIEHMTWNFLYPVVACGFGGVFKGLWYILWLFWMGVKLLWWVGSTIIYVSWVVALWTISVVARVVGII
jgi:hypothetical protein